MEERVEVYAVIRIDESASGDGAITVKEIVPTMEEAQQEVERRNRVNHDKPCHYFAQYTRFYPHGRNVVDKQ
jgi:hypothetical protein